MTSIHWFDSWTHLVNVLVSGTVGYVLLIFYIRLSGKRSTSRMNNFDWIVTVAVGSILASMTILKNVTVADGALAMGLLLSLQYALTLATSRWGWAHRLLLAEPRLLFLRGDFRRDNMRKERVSQDEIISAVRESGTGSLDEVVAVILEPDAELSVVCGENGARLHTIESVDGFEEPAPQGAEPPE